MSDGKSPQVSRTHLSVLAILIKSVVWIVSARPLISKSSSPFSNHLVIVPSAPDICRCLPPDTTWHKVKSPKAN